MEKYSTHLGTKDIPKEIKCNSPLFYFSSPEKKKVYILFWRDCRAKGILNIADEGAKWFNHSFALSSNVGNKPDSAILPLYIFLEKCLYMCIQKYVQKHSEHHWP